MKHVVDILLLLSSVVMGLCVFLLKQSNESIKEVTVYFFMAYMSVLFVAKLFLEFKKEPRLNEYGKRVQKRWERKMEKISGIFLVICFSILVFIVLPWILVDQIHQRFFVAEYTGLQLALLIVYLAGWLVVVVIGFLGCMDMGCNIFISLVQALFFAFIWPLVIVALAVALIRAIVFGGELAFGSVVGFCRRLNGKRKKR